MKAPLYYTTQQAGKSREEAISQVFLQICQVLLVEIVSERMVDVGMMVVMVW